MTNDNNKWGIIYCPRQGLFRSGKSRWEKIRQCLQDNGISYDHVQSESRDSVERLVRMMVSNGYKTIVIVGGDTALNDTINCLMQMKREERDGVALGLIPNGMMNDFAHFWGVTAKDYERAIKAMKKRRVKRLDLGLMRYQNKDGEPCRRYFINCVNIGLVAAIMNLRRQTHQIFGSRTLSFIFSFILLIFQRMDYKMRLRINSDKIDRRVMTICVGNAMGYGQTPNGVPYNGMLDVSVVYQPKTTQLFEGIYLFLRGKFINHHSVHPYRTRTVEVDRVGGAMVGVDGRLMHTPRGAFTVSVEPGVINFIMPS